MTLWPVSLQLRKNTFVVPFTSTSKSIGQNLLNAPHFYDTVVKVQTCIQERLRIVSSVASKKLAEKNHFAKKKICSCFQRSFFWRKIDRDGINNCSRLACLSSVWDSNTASQTSNAACQVLEQSWSLFLFLDDKGCFGSKLKMNMSTNGPHKSHSGHEICT